MPKNINFIKSNAHQFNYRYGHQSRSRCLPSNLQFAALASSSRNRENNLNLLFCIQSIANSSPEYQGSNLTIQKGEHVLTIPKNYIIRSNELNNPLANTLKLHNVSNSVLLLMSEFLTDSIEFRPYFNQVQIDVNNFPLYYSKEQLQQLNGSYLLEEIKTQRDEMLEVYGQLSQFINMTKSEFDRLYLFIQSRTFSYQGQHSALVPWAELVQHSNEQMMHFDYNDQEFYFQANYNIREGTELTFTYQKHTNQYLLQLYGFTLENNIYQAANFELCMNPLDRLYEIKLDIVGVKCTFYTLTNDSDSFQGPLSYFRMLEINSLVDLMQLEQNMADKSYQSLISLNLESKALQKLLQYFYQKLDSYSRQQVQQDINSQNIASIIQTEKAIYKFQISIIQLLLELIVSDNVDQMLLKLNKEQQFKTIRQYAITYIIPNLENGY